MNIFPGQHSETQPINYIGALADFDATRELFLLHLKARMLKTYEGWPIDFHRFEDMSSPQKHAEPPSRAAASWVVGANDVMRELQPRMKFGRFGEKFDCTRPLGPATFHALQVLDSFPCA